MPNSSREFHPANSLTTVPVSADQQQHFSDLLHIKEEYDLYALSIAAAGQDYLHSRPEPDLQQATLVATNLEHPWPTAARQFMACISGIGYLLRHYSIAEVVESRRVVLIEGALPPPSELLEHPTLQRARGDLVYGASKGGVDQVLGYAVLNRASVSDNLHLGFIKPATGENTEVVVPLADFKARHGFPPPPPPPPSRSRYSGL